MNFPTLSEPNLSPLQLRDKIQELENHMLSMPEAHVEMQVRHYFADGMYAREIFIPKGTVLTGKIHRTQHLNVVSQGKIRVWTEGGMKTIEAPFTMVSQPGTKRVGYALEDTVWTTFHATNETDLVKLEEQLIAPSHAVLEEEKKLCLG